jgi:hypothetical protein
MNRLGPLEQKFVAELTDAGYSQHDVARLACTSRKSVREVNLHLSMFKELPAFSRHRASSSQPELARLQTHEQDFLQQLLAEQPSLFLDECCNYLEMYSGNKLSVSDMCEALIALGHSRKVSYKKAGQASSFLEGAFLNTVAATVSAHSMAWLDEFGVSFNDIAHRRYGRAPVGERAIDRGLVLDRVHYSTCVVVTTCGVVAHYTVVGAVKGDDMTYFAERDLLQTLVLAGITDLIVDGSSIHKVQPFQDACAAVGITVHVLPPYTPWLNPTEPVIRSAKAYLRRHFQSLQGQGLCMLGMITASLRSISANVCASLIKDAGYRT